MDLTALQLGTGGGKKKAVERKFLKVVDDMTKQLDPDNPPREPKDWWEMFDEENRPIRREHFKDFKTLKEDNEQVLRMFLLKAGKKQQQSSMEAQLWKKKFEDQGKKDDKVNTEQVKAMIKGLREKTRLSEPVYSSDDSQAEENTGRAHFLWDNLNDNIHQTHVETLIARARVMWVLRDWSTMVTRSEEAIAMAEELDYPPLVAKCEFYLGVAMYGSRHFNTANDLFDRASACVGKYWEGSQVKEWQAKANQAMITSPPKSEYSSPDSRGQRRSQRGLYGGERLGDFLEEDEGSESGEE